MLFHTGRVMIKLLRFSSILPFFHRTEVSDFGITYFSRDLDLIGAIFQDFWS